MGRFSSKRTRTRDCPFKDDDGQVYARVEAMLGNGRCSTIDEFGVERLAIIRGNMRSREWIHKKDIVLLSLRDFQDGKADIVYRYTDVEVSALVRRAQLDALFAQGVDDRAEAEAEADVVFLSDDEAGVIDAI